MINPATIAIVAGTLAVRLGLFILAPSSRISRGWRGWVTTFVVITLAVGVAIRIS